MQHIIPTKVPYILFKLYYTFLYYIFQLAATYYKVKHKPLRGALFFSHNGLCFFSFYASSLFMLFSFYASSLSKRFFMLLVLIHRVDVLCRRADVVGGMIPATPKMISPVLIPTIMR